MQRKRLTSPRRPSDLAYLLARRGPRPVGRLAVHVDPQTREGRFGFLVIERPDDVDVVDALLAAASTWLSVRGCSTLAGPLSWTTDEEAGVLVGGSDRQPVTGRAWTPDWYGDVLTAAGLTVVEELRSYRLPTVAGSCPGGLILSPAELAVPAELAPYADPALLLAAPAGKGAVVAVPDVARQLGAGRPRGAWALARQARTRAWEGCVVLAVDGDESQIIPGFCAAAGRAGYHWVLSPWAPGGSSPALIHRLYGGNVDR
jgi:hypothetical protein